MKSERAAKLAADRALREKAKAARRATREEIRERERERERSEKPTPEGVSPKTVQLEQEAVVRKIKEGIL